MRSRHLRMGSCGWGSAGAYVPVQALKATKMIAAAMIYDTHPGSSGRLEPTKSAETASRWHFGEQNSPKFPSDVAVE